MRNALIRAQYRIHVDQMPIVSSKIISAFAHVNRALQVIHYSDVLLFNIAAVTINVQPERFAMREFVALFVHRIAIVSPINYVCKAFANLRVTTTRAVLIFNSVKRIFVQKKFDADRTKTVYSTKIASPIRTVAQNVEMHAKVAFCVAEMLNAQHVIIMQSVCAKLVSQVMHNPIAVALNAKPMSTVRRINSARRICVNWRVNWEKRAVKRHCVQLKIIVQFVIVNPASVAIRMRNVQPSIFVAIHHAALAQFVQITKAHSIALVVMDTSVIHTMKVVDWHSNAKQMPIVHQALNAFKTLMVQSVETFANASSVDRMPIVRRSITLPSVIADLVTLAKLLIFTSDADHFQYHVVYRPIARPIRIAMLASANQLVH